MPVQGAFLKDGGGEVDVALKKRKKFEPEKMYNRTIFNTKQISGLNPSQRFCELQIITICAGEMSVHLFWLKFWKI